MTDINLHPPVDDPTFGRLRISPDGAVVAEELVGQVTSQGTVYKPGDYFVWVRGQRIYYTTAEQNPEIASWPKLGVV
ncbi:uncharacterized protein RMCC_2420 [Mycolicibacterium canariasense]|uniref:Uncharacterized protein n=1 Tax=Mycolicibacterium canariasense TaxID=228230 RepID=A0A100WCD4_MYCCR|nr:hypothetical protein [Mycolicibacterium canariasense]MCV7212673.1 hypothetical protein [Mycolicibacterium canariasense]GAS95454.1 uncharacterized protein RMCC_2420 [Mycolicibacterium canariasense]